MSISKTNGGEMNSSIEEVAEKSEMETSDRDELEVQTCCNSWHVPAYRSKFFYSTYITLAFGVLGFCVGQRGPSFLDLQIITNVDLARGAAFFTSGSVGYLSGSFIGGIVYDKLNKILIMFITIFGMGVSTAIIPFCSPYALMVIFHLLTGIFMGGIDTCGNAELVRTWGAHGRSAMQTGHFAFALGGVISPLITQPFLAQPPQNTTVNATEYPTLYNTTTESSPLNTTIDSGPPEQQTTIVFYAYLISAFVTVVCSVPFLVTHFKVRLQTKKRTPGEEDTPTKLEFSLPVFVFTLCLICVMYMLYCCVEDSFAAYLMTFVVKSQGWSKTKGTLLTSVFWGAFALGRFCGILFVKFISSVKLLFICCFFLIISQVGFFLSSYYRFDTGIWVSAVGSGLSMSVFFPTGLTWTEEELVKMSGRVSSAILISASSGTMINPILLGWLMSEFSPMWYTYLLTAESVLVMIVFIILLVFARTYLKKHKRRNEIQVVVEANPENNDQKFL